MLVKNCFVCGEPRGREHFPVTWEDAILAYDDRAIVFPGMTYFCGTECEKCVTDHPPSWGLDITGIRYQVEEVRERAQRRNTEGATVTEALDELEANKLITERERTAAEVWYEHN